MGISLDPLRYGVRALDEMAREQASVAAPPPARTETFSPHPILRPAAREGAAFSLRLFGETEDDATRLVLGDDASRRFAPIPARAAALFEAHAAVLAADGDDALTIGFPLTTFVQQGTTRAAPLFSRGGAKARWKLAEAPWKLPSNARSGGTFPLPDALVLELRDDEPYTLHAGVWFHLFGFDGAALGAIATAGRSGAAALVRAAIRALDAGAEDVPTDEPPSDPLTLADLTALAEAASRRASPSRRLKCHPHGLAMLPPRGDPTSGLRSDLHGVLEHTVPPRGPLAVYLGASAAPSHRAPIFTFGRLPPTPSQVEAARAFEATEDIVAVCGPPGCGKTALLHHVTAQTVVACALGSLWRKAPSRTAPWPLVVTSTNNAAVDQALAPFVAGSGLPIGLRLGNRRAIAETTAVALSRAIEALGAEPTEGLPSLDETRAAFETLAAPVRAFLRKSESASQAQAAENERRRSLELRAASLRESLASIPEGPVASIPLEDLDVTIQALREHAEAAARVAPLHLDGENASVPRAREKWARANAVRLPRIAPVLATLGVAIPFGDLDPTSPHDDIARQRSAIEATVLAVLGARAALAAPAMRAELAQIADALGAQPKDDPEPPLDPALYAAALAVRDAWARAHRSTLLPRLVAARDAAAGEWSDGRKPLPIAFQEIAPLFPMAGCTLLSMRACFPLEREVIERLVIDEAAQCAPIYAVPALARARRVMFTGDVAQLPPVYTLDPRVDERLAKGLDEKAIAPFRMGAEAISSAQAVAEPRSRTRLALREHFRSQPPIVALASRWSGYSLDVRTSARTLADVAPRLAAPVLAYAVPGTGARAPEGVVNEAEVSAVVALVAELIEDGITPSDIAVLTPFVGQTLRIERELEARDLLGRDGVLVSTVHRLQGGERRVVIFSLTATARRHLRWLAERPHLLHVATSRAQDHLVVFVDPDAADQEDALAPLRELIVAAGDAGFEPRPPRAPMLF